MSQLPNSLSNDAIAETAARPKSISADGTAVQMPSVQEQIEAASFVAANQAARKPRRGIAITRLIPGSAVGRDRGRES